MRVARNMVLALGTLVGSTASAQDLTLQIDEQAATAFGIDTSTIESELEAQAGEALNLVDPQPFLDSMANAGGIAAKGMGVDYASNPKAFSVGGGVGASTHSAGFAFNRGESALPQEGFATMLSLMAGVNLGLLDGGKDTPLDRFVVYVNGMSLDMPGDREFGGSMYNVGAHVQAKVVKGPEAKVVEWGGLDLITGFERSSYKLSLERELPVSGPVDVQPPGASEPEEGELTWTADGTYELASTTDTIPVELASNVRVFIVSLYAGGALDIHTARSDATASLGGPIEARLRGQREDIGSAELDLALEGAGDPLVPRGFGGVQLNLTLLKIYGHLNVGANGAVGGHVGGRVAM